MYINELLTILSAIGHPLITRKTLYFNVSFKGSTRDKVVVVSQVDLTIRSKMTTSPTPLTRYLLRHVLISLAFPVSVVLRSRNYTG